MQFIPGTELSRRFYWETVRPILDAYEPNLGHAAARIGAGSDVLGFDTPMSTDHDWGPMVALFLADDDAGRAPAIHELLRQELPHEFAGYPVGAGRSPNEPGIRWMQASAEGPVEHRVWIGTLRRFVGWDPRAPLEPADWLTLSSQRLRELTAGALHFDAIGDLTALRETLAYYPHDIWLYLLASGWTRIGQEEHLMPRAGYVSDELGSALIGSRLVRDVINLCFLMERQYAPYPKWFGTAFGQLRCAADLQPLLWRAQIAPTWQEREAALAHAYQRIAQMHNALGITPPLDEQPRSFHDRPFTVIDGARFADAIKATITDPVVARIAQRRLIGNIDQWSDSTDLRADERWRDHTRGLYTE